MKAYQELSKEELLTLKAELNAAYEDAKGKGLKLDMSRGKPAVNQLDMTMDYLDVVNSQSAMKAEDGMDVRNYGCLLYTSPSPRDRSLSRMPSSA